MEQPDTSLQRVLGPIDATCIVIGAIVGVGIFFTPSHVAAIAGSSGVALLAWTVAGGIALLGALTFAELGGMYPNTGGQYQALRDAYGPMPAFLYVFCNATAIQAGAIAIIAVLCAENLAIAVANAGLDSMSVVLLAVVLICCLAAANIVGVRLGSRIQNATVYAKLVTLLVISGLAVWMSIAGGADASAAPIAAAPEPGAAKAGFGLVTVLFAAMVPAFFAFGGWQHALWIAGEIKEPRRNLPRAIIGGVLVVTIVYVLVNWAYFALLGYEQVRDSKAIAADAVSAHWSEFGRRTIAAAVAVSAFGVLNAQLLSARG